MARKTRQVTEQFQNPAPENKSKNVYRDEFQTNVGRKVENIGKKVEGNGRKLLYAIAALALLAIIIGIAYSWNRRANLAAQTALGKAIETAQAQVTSSPVPAGSIARTFKTEKERAEAAISEFQAVADKYGNPIQEKAKYFIAVNRLSLDRAAAIQELESLAKTGGETGTLSKFALAQAKKSDGKFDEAAALYSELAKLDNPIISKDTVNFELANIYEKQGKRNEAAELYFTIAKTASEAKDSEGKAIAMSQTAREAKEKLEAINPEKAKEIKEPEVESPFSGVSPGM
jgi:tetratricopeptide (TPR) repeat protein